jgi:hypothetical protein
MNLASMTRDKHVTNPSLTTHMSCPFARLRPLLPLALSNSPATVSRDVLKLFL